MQSTKIIVNNLEGSPVAGTFKGKYYNYNVLIISLKYLCL